MEANSMVKGVAKLVHVIFQKGDFVIAKFKPIEITEGEIFENEFSMKGNMSHVKKDTEYSFMAQEVIHDKYGKGYDVAFIRENITLDKTNKESIRNFLEVILTERQIDSVYSVTDDPIKAMEEGNVELLTKASGIGEATAKRIIKHYNNQKDYTVAYMELGGELGLTANSIKRVVGHYGSPDLAVTKIKENAFNLMDIDGYGFKKCDEIFLSLGGHQDSDKRIEAFLKHVLETRANEGHTWTSPQEVLKEAFEFIPTADKGMIGRLMLDHPDFTINESKTKISFSKYVSMEALIAYSLYNLVSAKVDFKYDGWEDIIKNAEEEQGWEYTDQQIEAMKTMFENNVVMVEGLAGTGKSTSLKVVLDVLESKGYSYVQSALSGQASSNLTLVTGREGYTIHRLLGFNPETGFLYNAKNPLPSDIIIVDEFSMVDAKLFMHLVTAIRKGAKLILLGDSGQLPSIGIPVMRPIIESGIIPHVLLDKIHRQAEKSAIATHSIEVRHGRNTAPAKKGKTLAGELEDLEYVILDSDDEIIKEVAIAFKKSLDDGLGVKEIQILSATRNKGFASCDKINSVCQKIYNPENEMLSEVRIGSEEDGYIIREGDKVINIKNNYNAMTIDGKESPVFNGNIGIVEYIENNEDEDGKKSSKMVINFEGIGQLVFKDSSYHCIELAYAVTVHKSQGMGIKRVIVALPYHYMLNSRQLLYTAITRAKKICSLITTPRTMKATVKKNVVDERRTYLAGMLKTLDSHGAKSFKDVIKNLD